MGSITGKTYTMIGGSNEERGLLPRAVEHIFHRINEVLSANAQNTVVLKMSILEVYHEKLRDLLFSGPKEQNLAIREQSDGTIWVEHLSEHNVISPEDCEQLLQKAIKKRVVGSHKLNEQSSRSHFCCLFTLHQVDHLTENVLKSRLSMIDLAGSEMVRRSLLMN